MTRVARHFRRLIAAVTVTCVAAAAGWVVCPATPPPPPLPPVLVTPDIVNIPTCERGQVAVARVTYRNAGNLPLVLTDITPSCACVSLTTDDGAEIRPTSSVTVEAGQEVGVVIKIRANDPPGIAVGHTLAAKSNDPRRLTAVVPVFIRNITGGVYFDPPIIAFGEVEIGTVSRKIVTIRDDAVQKRRVRAVAVTNPERFEVRRSPDPAGTDAGTAIARVEIVTRPGAVGPLDSELCLTLVGEARAADVATVTGRAVLPVVVSPATLVLPLASGTGPIFVGRVVCRAVSGSPLAVEVVAAPPDVDVSLDAPAAATATRTVAVTWRHDAATSGRDPRTETVKLRARIGDRDVPVEFRLRLTSPGPPP